MVYFISYIHLYKKAISSNVLLFCQFLVLLLLAFIFEILIFLSFLNAWDLALWRYHILKKTPYLKVDINICVAFQCSFITCKCVPESINSTSTSTHADIHAYEFPYTATFSPDFLIIHFCENFINYPKSNCETATYLIELLNNSHIPEVSRIFTSSFPLFSSPNVKHQPWMGH